MDQDYSIYDFYFAQGDRAQYTYINTEGKEKTLLVHVLDAKDYPTGKVYIVSAHKGSLDAAGIACDENLSNHYHTELRRDHKAAILDPDEMDPYISQFSIIVDNTRGNTE